ARSRASGSVIEKGTIPSGTNRSGSADKVSDNSPSTIGFALEHDTFGGVRLFRERGSEQDDCVGSVRRAGKRIREVRRQHGSLLELAERIARLLERFNPAFASHRAFELTRRGVPAPRRIAGVGQ